MARQKDTPEPLIAMSIIQAPQLPVAPPRTPIQKDPLLKVLLGCTLEKRLQLIEQLICTRC